MCLLAKEWKSKLFTKSYEIGNFYHTAIKYCAEHAVLNLADTNNVIKPFSGEAKFYKK